MSAKLSPWLVDRIAEAISTIRFGSMQLVIHDGRVVQIEQVEKVRVPAADLMSGGEDVDAGAIDRTTGGSPGR
jgi:hypothetical protein